MLRSIGSQFIFAFFPNPFLLIDHEVLRNNIISSCVVPFHNIFSCVIYLCPDDSHIRFNLSIFASG